MTNYGGKDYNNKAGATIKALREQKGLSQKNLIKHDVPTEQICSVRTLRRIEKGETTISLEILRKLLYALNVSEIEFADMLYGQDKYKFQNDFNEIWDLIFDEKYDKANDKLNTLKSKSYYDIDLPYVAQAMLLCKGILEKNTNTDYQKSYEVMHEALCKTLPSTPFKNGKISTEYISSHILTLNEYRIITVIANLLGHLDRKRFKIDILKATYTSLSNKEVDRELRKKLLPNVYYNLSNALIDERCYNDALNICIEALIFCKQYKLYKIYGEIIYNKAKSLLFLDDIVKATEIFRLSYNVFIAQGDDNKASFVKNTVLQKYNIRI